ncbi:MAG: hypothetical protein V5A79_06485 [Candidatus Bipolaricaulota bacterium]|nr:hypothetical protein [Candidatus Bipolaricaulota bacterium]
MTIKWAQKLNSKILCIVLTIIIAISFVISIFGASTTTSDTIILKDFSGTEHIYHEGFGNSNQTVITSTSWSMDIISVSGSSGSRTVLDQFISAENTKTKISRNALFIGSGSIDSDSIYKGSESQTGEDSKTGVFVTGDNYGVLIQNGSLLFNNNFGGIKESIATASGEFVIEQIGQFGTLSPSNSFIVGDISTLVRITGANSATLKTFNYGSVPRAGKDAFFANTNGWANGDTTFFFEGTEDPTSINAKIRIAGQGKIGIQALFETLEANAHFRIDNY